MFQMLVYLEAVLHTYDGVLLTVKRKKLLIILQKSQIRNSEKVSLQDYIVYDSTYLIFLKHLICSNKQIISYEIVDRRFVSLESDSVRGFWEE